MIKDEKTIYDSGETVYDSDATFPDSEGTVLDDAVLGHATVYDDGEDSSQSEKEADIEKGRMLLNTYRIESDAIEGGMGKVWRVHHNGWNVDLAMKQPKAALFQTENQKDNFIRECEAWINLGLHPHIVSCYYVRKISGIPTIFSEWMDVGSLKDMIEKSGLYSGDEKEQQERILDIAIQFARGLHYAHEQGLIHQDVKPDNLLLNSNGEAKVADFGIAKARAELTVLDADLPSDETMFSASGGYTPAYCSMEQMNGEKLTRRSDVYSWAVSVMEMYMGDRPWANGVIAGVACEKYFQAAKVPIPDSMKVLLKECMKEKEDRRPHDFAEIQKRLSAIYKEVTGKEYARPVPEAAADTSDSLNNRALSFLDLDKPYDAEKCWVKALEINPVHKQSVYNQNLHLWRTARIDDMEALKRIEALEGDVSELTAQLNLERGEANCIHTFFGHTDWVNSISVSSDGKRILSGSYKMIKLWDIETGACILTINGHEDSVLTVSLSKDVTRALSGSKDNTVRLWDLTTRTCIHTFSGHLGSVETLAFSPDDRFAVSGSGDKTIKLWDLDRGISIRTFIGHQNKITSVCFLPCGTKILSSSWDNTLKLWDVKSGMCVRTFTGHSEYVEAVCVTADGKKAVSGSWDNTLRIWDINTGSCIRTIEKCISLGNRIPVHSISISPNGSKLAMGSGDSILKLWDLNTKRCMHTYTGHTGSVHSVQFTPDGKHIVSGSMDKTIKLWDLPNATVASMRLSEINSIDMVTSYRKQFERLKNEIYTSIEKREIQNALILLKELSKVPLFGESSEYFDIKREVRRFCIMGRVLSHRVIAVYDREPTVDSRLPSCISEDGSKELYTNNWDQNNFYIRDLHGGKETRKFTGHTFYVKSLCFNTDGSKALSGSWDHTLKLWDIESGKCVSTFTGHEQGVNTACFSPDETKLLSGGIDNMVKLWDVASGVCIYTIKEHTEYVEHVSFEPDGVQIISLSDKKSILCQLDYELSFPGWSNWNEGARPYLEIFLKRRPNWTQEDFDDLIINLQNCGYGWLKPEGIKAKLREMKPGTNSTQRKTSIFGLFRKKKG